MFLCSSPFTPPTFTAPTECTGFKTHSVLMIQCPWHNCFLKLQTTKNLFHLNKTITVSACWKNLQMLIAFYFNPSHNHLVSLSCPSNLMCFCAVITLDALWMILSGWLEYSLWAQRNGFVYTCTANGVSLFPLFSQYSASSHVPSSRFQNANLSVATLN